MAAIARSTLDMGSNKIIALLDGTANTDAINLGQLDSIFSSAKTISNTWNFQNGAVLKDSTTYFYDDGDVTKQMRFQLSGITTGTTRNLTVPNADGIIALLSDIPSTSGFVAVGGNTLGAALTLGTTDAFDVGILRAGTQVATVGATTIDFTASVSATNTAVDRLIIGTNSTGTAAANFGASILYKLESSTTNDRDAFRLKAIWTTATDASRTSALDVNPVISGAEVNMFRFGSTGLLVRNTSAANTMTISSGGLSATQTLTLTAAGNQIVIGNSSGIITIASSATGSASISLDATSPTGTIRTGATTYTSTTLAKSYMTFQDAYTVASGSGTYTALNINNIFNLTGTASGVQRGIHVNPSFTSLVGTASYRAIDIASNGSNTYGIYQSGSTASNVFAGSVGVGTVGALARTLHVQGTMRLTGDAGVTATGFLGTDASGDVTKVTTVPVNLGGTGLTTLIVNRIPYGNGTSAFQSSGNLTFDGTTLSVTGKASVNIGGSYSSGQNFFSVSGTVTGTSNSADYNGFYFAPVFANDGTVTNNSLAGLRFSQSSAGSTAGISYNIVTGNTNTSANVSQLYGLFARIDENTTTGNLSVRTTARFQCFKNSNAFDSHTGTGIQVDLAENSTSGRWNNGSCIVVGGSNAITLRGINQSLSHTKGTGNTQYGIALSNTVSGAGVVVANAYGIELRATASASGVITNYYGIYQNSIPSGATLTYFLYNNNNARSYTNGSFAIGTDATTAKLLVRGSGTTSSTKTVLFENSSGADMFVLRDDQKVAFFNASYNEAFNMVGAIRTDAGGFVAKSSGDAQSTATASALRLWNDTASTGKTWYVESRDDGKFGISNGDSSTRWLSILSSGKVGLNKETPGYDLEVGGEIAGRHVIGNATANPTNSLGSSTVVGTGASCSVVGNDIGMSVNLILGTGISATGTVVTITFNLAYPTAPSVAYPCPKDSVTAAAFEAGVVWLETTSTTVVLKNSNQFTSSQTLNFDIIVIGRQAS